MRERGNDNSFFHKVLKEHGKGSALGRPKRGDPPSTLSGDERKGIFTIQHFAGGVSYTPEGFVKRNADSFSEEIGELFSESKENVVLAEIFQSEEAVASFANDTAEKKQNRFGDGGGRRSKKPKDKTVAGVFRRDINALVKDIGPAEKKTHDNPNPEWSTDPHFIRCIRLQRAEARRLRSSVCPQAASLCWYP